MKKTIALLLALLFVFALFTGCNNGGGTPATQAPATQAPATQAPATKAPATQAPATQAPETQAPATEEPVDEGPYHMAAGKYAKDDRGFPVEKYVYQLPFCDDDTILTDWTSCFTPQWIPEGGFGEIETWRVMREKTGVHIEYDVVEFANRSQNFSVLLASDSLDDIMEGGASFYKQGTLKDAVEDGYFVNFYEYADYLPNYMYESKTRAEVKPTNWGKFFYDPTTIPVLYGITLCKAPLQGYYMRQDWLDKLGMGKAEDYKTYDDVYKALVAFKTNMSNTEYNNCEIYPFYMPAQVETYEGSLFSGMDLIVSTIAMNYPRVINGKVEMCGGTVEDKEAIGWLNKLYNDGLLSPNFHSFGTGGNNDGGQLSDQIGCYTMTCDSLNAFEASCIDPNTHWSPIPRTKRTEDQVIKFGYYKCTDDYTYGSAVVSAKCKNIPLACTWIDWCFSDEGSDFVSWGPEGVLWEYNDQGERRLTDWCVNHEATPMWLINMYAMGGLLSCCLLYTWRNNYTDYGMRIMSDYDVFAVPDYLGEYDWPTGVQFNDDERESNTATFADLNTYFAENYNAFIDNSRPMSEWDSYIEGLYSFGLSTILSNYQTAYDRYEAAAAVTVYSLK